MHNRTDMDVNSDRNECKRKRTSFISILCKLQRGILICGGVMFVIWFSITYSFQDNSNSKENIVAMKRTAAERSNGMEDFMEQIITSGRLMDHVIPHHYNLTLQLFMPPEHNFTTKGRVNILVECLEKTKAIVLHSKDLTVIDANITQIEFKTENQTTHKTSLISVPEKDLLFIYLDEALLKNKRYVLDVSFNGTINNQSVGLYRSSYNADGSDDTRYLDQTNSYNVTHVKQAVRLCENSRTSWIASTQFQPSDARRVFPCFDEPRMKSTFQANIIRKKDTVVLSNMPDLRIQEIDENWEVVTFEFTPTMSSYLLALVVGDVKPFAKDRNKGVQVWSRSDMVQYGEYAYSIAGDMLEYLGDYLEVPYKMPKTDLAAIPRFLHAAMENWGLITFTEAALLYDPERSSTESKVFITIVVAHEIAHQWFGNLVTTEWWDNLWLNEGFASFYEYVCVDHIKPEWNISQHFISSIYDVMETDSLSTTRAMAAPVPADDVLEYFDEIAYLKGGAMVHMLQHFLGEKNFRKGLKNYLWKYSYKNAKEKDLWQNLNLWNKNEIGVKQIMKTWTTQAGYPVIKIERNYSNKSAKVSQKVFLLEPEEIPLEEGLSVTGDIGKDKRLWIIPITYTNGVELDWSTKTDFWLKSRSNTIKNIPDERTWFLANIQQVGYYRVNYDAQNWEMLLLQLLDDHTVIHAVNRAQILNDAMNLARSDEVDYSIALNMTKYLYHEEDYLPWQAAFTCFRYIDLMLSKTSAHKAWKEYVLTLMSPLYERLGWTDSSAEENISKKYLRKKILKWSCDYGREDCVKTAVLLYNNWKNGTESNLTLTSDDREVVLCTGIAKGTTEDWELMWKKYLNETFKGEKNILLKSLACTKDIKLLEKLLLWVLNYDSGLDLEDGSDVIVYVAENFQGREVVYNFFKNNAANIMQRFGSFPFAASNMIERVIAPLNTINEIRELENILKRRESVAKGFRHSVKTALQRAKINLKWMEHKYEEVNIWLQENPIEE